MSSSTQQLSAVPASLERRFYTRFAPYASVFIAFDENNESLLLNISENGLLLSTPIELSCNSVARISIPLDGFPKPVQVSVRVVWASEPRKLAGIQLLNLTEHDRERIRKWGARMSAQSSEAPPSQAGHAPVIVAPSTDSSEMLPATDPAKETASLSGTGDAAPPPIARARSAPTAARLALWGGLIATVSVGAVLVLRNAALGNPSAHSIQNHSADSNAPASVKDSRNASLLPAPGAINSSNAPSSTPALNDFAQTGNSTGDRGLTGSVVGAAQNPHDRSRIKSTWSSKPTLRTNRTQALSSSLPEKRVATRDDQPLTGAVPAAKDTAPTHSTPQTQPAISDPSTTREPLRHPIHTNDVAAVPSSTIPSNPIVPAAQPAPPPEPVAPVIQMDAPGRQTLEIQFPPGRQACFYNLPGERVLESPAVTVHIQRSVLMPASQGGWHSHRSKRVVVGELLSRVDPLLPAKTPTNPSDSVRVKATVAKDGRMVSVKPLLGPSSLFPAVVNAVREWRYQPTFIDGKPVETQCYIVVQFHKQTSHLARW